MASSSAVLLIAKGPLWTKGWRKGGARNKTAWAPWSDEMEMSDAPAMAMAVPGCSSVEPVVQASLAAPLIGRRQA